MILSTVRSLPGYMIEPNPTHGWCIQNLGFITDRNQVNVALTRARKGLFVIGKISVVIYIVGLYEACVGASAEETSLVSREYELILFILVQNYYLLS